MGWVREKEEEEEMWARTCNNLNTASKETYRYMHVRTDMVNRECE